MEDEKELNLDEMDRTSGGSLHFVHISEPYVDWTCPVCSQHYRHQQYIVKRIIADHEDAHNNNRDPLPRSHWY